VPPSPPGGCGNRVWGRQNQQVVQPHELPQLTLGVPEPAQVAVHCSTPQLRLELAQALLAAPQVSVQVPVPQSIVALLQAPFAVQETEQA